MSRKRKPGMFHFSVVPKQPQAVSLKEDNNSMAMLERMGSPHKAHSSPSEKVTWLCDFRESETAIGVCSLRCVRCRKSLSPGISNGIISRSLAVSKMYMNIYIYIYQSQGMYNVCWQELDRTKDHTKIINPFNVSSKDESSLAHTHWHTSPTTHGTSTLYSVTSIGQNP